MTRFSLNLNKIALLRNSRGAAVPDVLATARQAIALGVKGITVHPRPDGRHIQSTDVLTLAELCAQFAEVEFNVEGYPSDDFLTLVALACPDQVTLVPDDPEQLTSDHGWRVRERRDLLSDAIRRLKSSGRRVSLFMDPDCEQIGFLDGLGADRIELYTAAYAAAHGTADGPSMLARYRDAARHAQACGLGVNAGHDLSQLNLADFLQAIPDVLEVSIGHAVICEAINQGLPATISSYLSICAGESWVRAPNCRA